MILLLILLALLGKGALILSFWNLHPILSILLLLIFV